MRARRARIVHVHPENTVDKDRQIQKDVEDELAWEPSIDEAGIGVAVANCIVTLYGKVHTHGEKSRAEKAALGVRSVLAVADDLEVEVGPKLRRTDAEIAQSAVTAIGLMVSVPKDKIKVVVRDGEVTLEGEVEWDYHRKAAASAVQDLAGVKKVMNLIVLKPTIAARELRRKISQAFHRSAQLDAEHVQVEVDGSRVTLLGTVSSWEEKAAAERTAWAAPGVTDVRNIIAIQGRAPAPV
jgi:osmotically-inducible protein OsmY